MLEHEHDSALTANKRGGCEVRRCFFSLLCRSNGCHLGVVDCLIMYLLCPSASCIFMLLFLRCGANKVCMCVWAVCCVCVCVYTRQFTLDRAGLRRHILPSVVQTFAPSHCIWILQLYPALFLVPISSCGVWYEITTTTTTTSSPCCNYTTCAPLPIYTEIQFGSDKLQLSG